MTAARFNVHLQACFKKITGLWYQGSLTFKNIRSKINLSNAEYLGTNNNYLKIYFRN